MNLFRREQWLTLTCSRLQHTHALKMCVYVVFSHDFCVLQAQVSVSSARIMRKSLSITIGSLQPRESMRYASKYIRRLYLTHANCQTPATKYANDSHRIWSWTHTMQFLITNAFLNYSPLHVLQSKMQLCVLERDADALNLRSQSGIIYFARSLAGAALNVKFGREMHFCNKLPCNWPSCKMSAGSHTRSEH